MKQKRRRAAPTMERWQLEKVADVFRVFSEATRLAILQALKESPMSVNELVEHTETSQANVSKQLRVLYDAGFLTREKQGNKVFYRIDEEMIFPLCELVCEKLNRDAKRNPAYDFSI